jgi:hypothetical protein
LRGFCPMECRAIKGSSILSKNCRHFSYTRSSDEAIGLRLVRSDARLPAGRQASPASLV